MGRVVRILFVMLALFMVPEVQAAGPLVPVDDGYTASQRYDAYKAQFPLIELPQLTFASGQRILFDRRYKEVGGRELHTDVFLPAPSKRRALVPGIVFIHGGGWRAGNKSEFYPMANLLAQRGYAVFLPEYRLSPEAPYPAGLVDINDAIAWAKDQAAAYGVDSARIALAGGSSGGQMAALLAYTADRDLFKSRSKDDTRVAALIDFDGVLDFMAPLALQYENAAGDESYAALWLGGSMEHATANWQAASAARYVGTQSPPTLIVSSGESRFTAGKDEVLAALERNGIPHRYVQFENVPHTFWLFEPYLSKATAEVDSFLRALR
jgi:pectinesterase